LLLSRRRCALCFFLDRDHAQKKGQIAHLDRRRANSLEDNLAFLCLNHHTDYDSTTSQHKNYTIPEVKAARKALYAWVKKGMPSLAEARRQKVVRTLRTHPGAKRTTARLPERRPKVAPTSYGKSGAGQREGVYLINEGTPAHGVRIEKINLRDGWIVRFYDISGPLQRTGFSQAWISRGNTGSTTLDPVWRGLNKSSTIPAIFPFIISYKDFDGRGYRSVCELHRDVLKKSGFDVRFVRQELIESQGNAPLAQTLTNGFCDGQQTIRRRSHVFSKITSKLNISSKDYF